MIIEYSPGERFQIVMALRTCKKYLSKDLNHYYGKSSYICMALDFAVDSAAASAKTEFRIRNGARMAKDVIAEKLEGTGSLSVWVRQRLVGYQRDVFDRMRNNSNGCEMQAHRLAWVNILIKEFSGPG